MVSLVAHLLVATVTEAMFLLLPLFVGALALVLATYLVMARNTHQIQATLDRWRAEGRQIDPQILHHVTPMGFQRINFGGILVFPLER
jgi:hypothetical protein